MNHRRTSFPYQGTLRKRLVSGINPTKRLEEQLYRRIIYRLPGRTETTVLVPSEER